jgi:hypothetical protein
MCFEPHGCCPFHPFTFHIPYRPWGTRFLPPALCHHYFLWLTLYNKIFRDACTSRFALCPGPPRAVLRSGFRPRALYSAFLQLIHTVRPPARPGPPFCRCRYVDAACWLCPPLTYGIVCTHHGRPSISRVLTLYQTPLYTQ